MATITLFKSYNFDTELDLFKLYPEMFTDPSYDSSDSHITLPNPSAGSVQYYYGNFAVDGTGDFTDDSRVTDLAIQRDAVPVLDATGLNIPVSFFATLTTQSLTSRAILPFGMRGHDVVNGSSGDDVAYGYEGNDTMIAFAGNDLFNGHYGNDSVNGHAGHDTIRGGAGNDAVRGGADNDRVYGDLGDDTLYGDKGADVLYGGDGADQFVFKAGDGYDRIVDFEEVDTIMIHQNTGTRSFADLDISVESGNTTIDLGNGDRIVLLVHEGVDAGDFGFFA